jgi:D-methionine transport system permease protein
MSGTVGGGGLGDIAVRYGYYRWQTDIMIVTVLLLILIFQIIQNLGTRFSMHIDHRKH